MLVCTEAKTVCDHFTHSFNQFRYVGGQLNHNRTYCSYRLRAHYKHSLLFSLVTPLLISHRRTNINTGTSTLSVSCSRISRGMSFPGSPIVCDLDAQVVNKIDINSPCILSLLTTYIHMQVTAYKVIKLNHDHRLQSNKTQS